MIKAEEAGRIILESARILNTEAVELKDSLGCVLAQDVISDIDMPPFDKSAMDGFACRAEDLDGELEIIETIPAGYYPQKMIGKGQCSRIMTGAAVPQGADTVIMVEETKVTGDRVAFLGKTSKSNICYRAEDVKQGDFLLEKGMLISPRHVAVMAAVGVHHPLVSVKPKIGVLTTGDELVEPDAIPGKGQIRNSNAHQLVAQIHETGSMARYYGIIPDHEKATFLAIEKAISENDIVLLTGGVSMGDFDFVPKVLLELGVEIKFDSIAIQPGKPTVFGVKDDTYIFGLPGNPVSSLVQFELHVKPLIFKLQGAHYIPVQVLLPLGKSIRRKRTDRQAWVPVSIRNNRIETIDYHGSAHIHSYSRADGLVCIPLGVSELKEGEEVYVRRF